MIAPCLWFDGDALEAADFYVSLFADSSIDEVSPGPDGVPLMVFFTLMGRRFQALNGGPQYTFSEAMSLAVPCDDQAEVDRLWQALSDGGVPGECGWLKDRYGVSWQIVPTGMSEVLGDPDPERRERAVRAMLQMSRLDLEELRRAADGAA